MTQAKIKTCAIMLTLIAMILGGCATTNVDLESLQESDFAGVYSSSTSTEESHVLLILRPNLTYTRLFVMHTPEGTRRTEFTGRWQYSSGYVVTHPEESEYGFGVGGSTSYEVEGIDPVTLVLGRDREPIGPFVPEVVRLTRMGGEEADSEG